MQDAQGEIRKWHAILEPQKRKALRNAKLS